MIKIKLKINIIVALAIGISIGVSSCGKPYKKVSVESTVVSVSGAATSLKRITTGGLSEYINDVSPDGKWLLMEAEDTGNKSDKNIVLQKFNLSNRTRVVLTPKNSKNKDAAWLNDMSGYVFVTDRLGNNTIVQSLGVSGESGVRFITQQSLGSSSNPAVNPVDGDIAFTVISNNFDSRSLAIINPNGFNLRMYGSGFSPQWSPNGRILVFTRKVGDVYRIYSMDTKTGSGLIELSSSDANDFSPTWSPDGKYIAFISNRTGSRHHLFVMSSTGSIVTQLTNGELDVRNIAWSKSGEIYFSSNAGGNWDIWSLKPKLN